MGERGWRKRKGYFHIELLAETHFDERVIFFFVETKGNMGWAILEKRVNGK